MAAGSVLCPRNLALVLSFLMAWDVCHTFCFNSYPLRQVPKTASKSFTGKVRIPLPLKSAREEDEDTHDQSSENNKNTIGPTSIEDRLNRLNFGFQIISSGNMSIDSSHVRLDSELTLVTQNLKSLKSFRRKDTLPRTMGCAPLLSGDVASGTVSGGVKTHPFFRLRCPRGHEWTAVGGTPTATRCPSCGISREEAGGGGLGKPPSLAARGDAARRARRGAEVEAARAARVGRERLPPELLGNLPELAPPPPPLPAGKKKKRHPPAVPKPRQPRRSWDLEQVKELAEARCGSCLSRVYRGTKVPMVFQCMDGHIFESRLEHVRRGSWCPECAVINARESRRLTIDDMKATARFFDGIFVSKDYHSVNEKLLWQCARGHLFRQYPNNIRRRKGGGMRPQWCPKCFRIDGPPRYFVNRKRRVPTASKNDDNDAVPDPDDALEAAAVAAAPPEAGAAGVEEVGGQEDGGPQGRLRALRGLIDAGILNPRQRGLREEEGGEAGGEGGAWSPPEHVLEEVDALLERLEKEGAWGEREGEGGLGAG